MDAKDVKFSLRPFTIGELLDFKALRKGDSEACARFLASRADPPLTMDQIRAMPLMDWPILTEGCSATLPEVDALFAMELGLRNQKP